MKLKCKMFKVRVGVKVRVRVKLRDFPRIPDSRNPQERLSHNNFVFFQTGLSSTSTHDPCPLHNTTLLGTTSVTTYRNQHRVSFTYYKLNFSSVRIEFF